MLFENHLLTLNPLESADGMVRILFFSKTNGNMLQTGSLVITWLVRLLVGKHGRPNWQIFLGIRTQKISLTPRAGFVFAAQNTKGVRLCDFSRANGSVTIRRCFLLAEPGDRFIHQGLSCTMASSTPMDHSPLSWRGVKKREKLSADLLMSQRFYEQQELQPS